MERARGRLTLCSLRKISVILILWLWPLGPHQSDNWAQHPILTQDSWHVNVNITLADFIWTTRYMERIQTCTFWQLKQQFQCEFAMQMRIKRSLSNYHFFDKTVTWSELLQPIIMCGSQKHLLKPMRRFPIMFDGNLINHSAVCSSTISTDHQAQMSSHLNSNYDYMDSIMTIIPIMILVTHGINIL